ncbi:DNA cytosine methyltransferase [Rufibacter quisquiliarum]|uniref:DNA (cytosine-5-)-methyltransferase n=1 Tax=Rufibacter quisquiliarum TaxID=1549639 RepID=A0A839GHB8_9BACT|nr:DNA cytosine methyltransferase [Rufibacter quisquiliarum]MBA9076089.1 DNA (cytosine-5)-methyltransferase 1 [Rufibacter quisquiliarum]
MILKHNAFFNGIGGFCLAAKQEGIETVATVEIDEWCNKQSKRHFPDAIQFTDINTVTSLPFADIWSGGFPCQDASNARTHSSGGKHTGHGVDGARTGLWWSWLELIKTHRPQIIVGENVTAIRSKGLDKILQSLAEIGYDAEWCDLSASEFGAPHSRARTWVVAYPHGFGRGEESIIFSQIVGRPIPQAPEWEPSRAICSTYRKKTLPEAYGIHDGLPRKLDKGGLDPEIKAYGNAIAPPVARAIFRAIKEVLL